MKKQQRNYVELHSHNILNVMFRLKDDTGKLAGMQELYDAVQPFTTGDLHKPKTRLKKATTAVNTIVDQVDLQQFETLDHILCDNMRAYLRELRHAFSC